MAAIEYGITRTTFDVDVVVELEPFSVEPLAKRLGPQFELDAQRTFEVFTGKPMQLIRLRGTPLKIDLFPLTADPFDQERFRRRRKVRLEGREAFMPSAEDVVVQKLRRGRAKDLQDAVDVMAVQGAALDYAYIKHWCEQHGTRALLDKLRSEIPPE